MQIWNVYRSRALGYLWQQHGLKVISTLQHSDSRSFDFCFEGIPKGTTLATSSVGVKTNKDACNIWRAGMKKALEVINPKTLILYGGGFSDFDFGNTKSYQN